MCSSHYMQKSIYGKTYWKIFHTILVFTAFFTAWECCNKLCADSLDLLENRFCFQYFDTFVLFIRSIYIGKFYSRHIHRQVQQEKNYFLRRYLGFYLHCNHLFSITVQPIKRTAYRFDQCAHRLCEFFSDSCRQCRYGKTDA